MNTRQPPPAPAAPSANPSRPRRTALAPLATKPDFALCLERIEAWFHQAVLDRPPVRFYKHNAQFDAGQPLDRARWTSLEERWFDTAYQIESFEASLVGKTFHAETFPVFTPNLGPSVYSAFYAGRLEFAETTSWYHPVLTDLDDLSVLHGDPFASPYFRNLEEQTRAALARCGDRYWVGYTDLHPSLDCIAAWRGIDALCLDLADAPEQLAPLVELSVRDFHRIFDHFDAMLQSAAQPSGTWINIPYRGKLHIPSCDVSTMLSPAHFAEFSQPQLRRELVGMHRAIYHVDGRGVARHLDAILAHPEIQAIQWVQGLGPDWPILQWLPLLRRILDAGKSVLVDVPGEELDEFMRLMPREGVFLCLGVPEGAEAATLARVARWGK
ncbi:MAG: hypothetical protein FJ399_18515 [Verrucomicrobia bacterium]|nr:hypothetical protein [Verrucomicrobiota bacterium]